MHSKSVKRTLTISVLLLFLGGCKATFVETYNNGTPYKAMARAVGDADLARGEEGEQDFRFSSGGSPTYGQWVSEELTFENGKQLYIPEGFLHGFVTLEPNSEIIYKCTNFYNKSSEGCVRFNDPDLKKDLVSLKMIKNISLNKNNLSFEIVLTTPACPLKEKIKNDCLMT